MECIPAKQATLRERWSCPWCDECAPKSRHGLADDGQDSWTLNHIGDHVNEVEATLGEAGHDMSGTLDTSEGLLVIADRFTLEYAGASHAALARMTKAARALSAEEFAEEYSQQFGETSADRRIVYAAKADTLEVVGYALAQSRTCSYTDEPPATERHLEQLAVALQWRRLGVGSELLQAVVCEAEQMEVPITLWSLKSRREFYAAWHFYQTEPPAVPNDVPAADTVYLRAEAR